MLFGGEVAGPWRAVDYLETLDPGAWFQRFRNEEERLLGPGVDAEVREDLVLFRRGGALAQPLELQLRLDAPGSSAAGDQEQKAGDEPQ